jgi:hypothetical protein
VLKITIGLSTGAARRKAIPVETGSPFRKRRRVSGMTPHSQTGNTNPSIEPSNAAGNVPFGERRVIQSCERKTSTSPEASVPNKRKGTASINIPKNTVAKITRSCHNNKNAGNGTMLMSTAPSTPSRISQINGRESVRLGIWVSTV